MIDMKHIFVGHEWPFWCWTSSQNLATM